MANRLSNPNIQYFDGSGAPLAGGKLKFTATGSSSTLKDTYSDSALSSANTNPVILDAAGRAGDIFLDGAYRVTLFDSSDVQIWQADPVGDSVSSSPWSDWASTTVYAIGDIAQGSDGDYYKSITASNTGNDPTASAANWSKLSLSEDWNTNKTYDDEDIVRGSNGYLYSSQAGSNQGNDPTTDQTNWNTVTPRPKIGTISIPAATTEISITGIGFKPSVIQVFGTVASGAYISSCQGLADGTNEHSITQYTDGTNAGSYTNTTLWTIRGAGAGKIAEGSLSSLDSDGFTIDPTTFSSACTLHYIAFP